MLLSPPRSESISSIQDDNFHNYCSVAAGEISSIVSHVSGTDVGKISSVLDEKERTINTFLISDTSLKHDISSENTSPKETHAPSLYTSSAEFSSMKNQSTSIESEPPFVTFLVNSSSMLSPSITTQCISLSSLKMEHSDPSTYSSCTHTNHGGYSPLTSSVLQYGLDMDDAILEESSQEKSSFGPIHMRKAKKKASRLLRMVPLSGVEFAPAERLREESMTDSSPFMENKNMYREIKRKESHNMIERRRRNVINDCIQELGGIVPRRDVQQSKGLILQAAVEYTKQLKQENLLLKQRLRFSEMQQHLAKRMIIYIQKLESHLRRTTSKAIAEEQSSELIRELLELECTSENTRYKIPHGTSTSPEFVDSCSPISLPESISQSGSDDLETELSLDYSTDGILRWQGDSLIPLDYLGESELDNLPLYIPEENDPNVLLHTDFLNKVITQTDL